MISPASSFLNAKEAQTFPASFQNFKTNFGSTSKAWLSPASPWAPYFKIITTQKATKELNNLEQQGRCDEVMSEVLRNFIGQTPHLSSVFFKPDIQDNFEQTLVPALSLHYQRCKAWQKLITVIERAKRSALFMPAPTLNMPYFSFAQQPKDLTQKAGKNYHSAVITLTRLGLCQNDQAALKDLQTLSRQSYSKLFQEAESLYMDAHAKRLGIETNHYQMIKEVISNNRGKGGQHVSYEPQKLFSMQARLQAGDWQKAGHLVPHLTELCRMQTKQ